MAISKPVTISWSHAGVITVEFDGAPSRVLSGSEDEARKRANHHFGWHITELHTYSGLSWIES
jgi:hypothetical protein